ncbi:MAG: diguanylate cyclase [Gammaproteobacteria bacterium]|nr:diguanylate cyclase [Pseudomonadales bacterium]MCP5329530.1 diguanylate cyclase [Pseudomonadales bacterium]
MGNRNKLDQFLSQIYRDEGAQGIVDSLSFLFGAFVVSRDGVIIGANQAFLDLIDYPLAAIIGMRAIDLVPEEQRHFLSSVFSGNLSQPYQLSLRTRLGGIRHTQVAPKLFQVDKETYRLAEFVDITDTLEAEAELRASEAKFKAIFSHAAIGIARIDINGQWLEINQKLCDILGYSEQELRTLAYRDISYPGDLPRDEIMLAELVSARRESYCLDTRCVRKDGKIIWGHLTVSLIRDAQGHPDYFVVFLEDITAQVSLRDRLTLSDDIVSASTDLLAIFDEHIHYRATNEAYANAFGLQKEELPGRSASSVLGETFFAQVLRPKIAALRQGSKINYSVWFDFPNHERRYMNVSYYPLQDDEANFRGFAASARDITELKTAEMEMRELNEKLERYSFVDGLTSINNRRMLDISLVREWNRARRAHAPISFIMIDIDFFKLYNDHYGHLQGDECLKKIANILSQVAGRSSDVVARFGGEEFAILAPDATLAQAVQLAEKCRLAVIDSGIEHALTQVPTLGIVSISIGVSCLEPDADNQLLDLIELADKHLYKAKRQGRNCSVYD